MFFDVLKVNKSILERLKSTQSSFNASKVNINVVITEYRKIYKVMSDNMWATPEVFNNVHPQLLGGLHTIMSFSGSVGNLWWCRHNAIW